MQVNVGSKSKAAMTTIESRIKSRKVTQIVQGKGTFNDLDAAGSLLQKKRLVPSRENLDQAHKGSDKPSARRGQLIDILV